MSWMNVIFMIVVALLVRLLFFFLDRYSKNSKADGKGVVTMKMMAFYVYFGLFVTGFGLLSLISGFRNLGEESSWMVLLVGLIAGGFGAYITAFGRGHKVAYTETDVEVKTWKGKTTSFKWEDITHMQYLRTKGVFRLTLKDTEVDCHYHIKGITNFLRLAQDKSRVEVLF